MNYRNRYEEYKNSLFEQGRFRFLIKLLLFFVISVIFNITIYHIQSQVVTLNTLNKYINILNSLFSLSLLLVTAIYVYHSKKIVDLTREKSQRENIPKIYIFPEDPTISASQFGHTRTKIEFILRVYNFSEVPVFNSNINFSIPYEAKETKETSFCSYSLNEFPKLIKPNSNTENVITMHTHFPIKSIEEYKKSFLDISYHFEDLDRNLHIIHQYYDLNIGFEFSFFSWNILLDEHYYIQRQKRKYTNDLSSIGYLPAEYILVYRKTNT